ncbi:MAG: hydrophobic/amphiphilic exporter-1, HAE1 family [Chloroflexi bacterium CSP1-4]|nr:MAG: hydrophobic/amphiphilic exporter-1, HAE1 family [Chloroflexi bacterium CSP1-4]
MYRLTELAVRRASVTFLLAAAVFVAGILSWGSLKSELLPDIDFPIVTVITPYSGAGTTDVAEQVTKPVERTLSGVARVTSLRSTSAAGLSIVVADFSYGTDIKAAVADIEASLRSAGLPFGVSPLVTTLNINAFPILSFTVQGSGSTEVGALVRDQVVPELAGIPGVASVDATGGDLERVEVMLDPLKLAASGISVQQVSGVLQANDLTSPSGTIVNGEATLPVTTSHRFRTIDEIRDLIVGFEQVPPQAESGAQPAPKPIAIGDLGTVEFARDPAAGTSRTDGTPSVALSVVKSSDANTVDVTKAVEARMADLKDRLDLTVVYAFRSADFIEQSIEGLVREGGLGAAFAVFIIFMFLLNVRSTLVAAMSIPLSVMAALLLMLVGGVSLNIMTLGGLAVAVGRVVDDAIVVLENIFRHHRANREPIRQAVIEGTREVAVAITSSTITTVAVFLPIGFVGGLVTQFFLPFSLTVTFALLASLAVALTVVPVLAYFLVPRVKHAPGAGEVGAKDTWVQRIYTPLLRLALRFRGLTLAVAAGLFAVSMALVPLIPTAFLNVGSDKILAVIVAPPAGTTATATLARAIEAEKLIDADPTVITYHTSVAGEGDTGFATVQSSFFGRSASSATILVTLADTVDLDEATRDLLARLAPIDRDGYSVSVGQITSGGGRLQVVVASDDAAALDAATNAITAAVKGIPDVVNVSNDLAEETPELQLRVDPNKAIALGLTTDQVSRLVRGVLAGQTAIRAVLDGRPGTTPVFVRVDPAAITDPAAILPLLRGTATIEEVQAQATITRVDQRPSATVSGDVLAKDTGGTSVAVQKAIDALGLPSSVTVELTGITQQQTEGFSSLLFAMLISIGVVYIVMVVVFGSLLDPFIILFSLPLATIGAFAGLLLTGRAMGISALIGMLMLIGILVTNAIVFVDLVEQLRRKGYSIEHALVHAGRTRVRPILMTALATILALIPLALGLNQGSIIAAELGTVVIGGLFTSTLLTLVVVPVVYSLVHGGRARVARAIGRESHEEPHREAPTA